MSTALLAKTAVPTVETCPNCKGEMTLAVVAPVLFTNDFEDVTYKCKRCRSEMKRTFKRHSGTRHPVRYTA
jgi:primosomal protein N'